MGGKRKIKLRHSRSFGSNKLSRFVYRLVFLLFLSGVIYLLFFSGLLAVNKINLSGLEELNRGKVLREIQPYLEGKYGRVIPKNNLLLIRTGIIKRNLLNKFSKIETVSIKRNFPAEINIFVHERKSVLALCSADNCYTVDEKGKTFMPFDREESGPLIILSDRSNKTLGLNESALDLDYLNYILGTKNKLKSEVDIQVKDEYETPSLASSDIRLSTQEGWRIYFNKDITLDKELEMLQAVLDNKIGSDKRAYLEYIDLRSDNKVYYKFKDGTQEEAQNNPEEKPAVAGDNKKEDKKKK